MAYFEIAGHDPGMPYWIHAKIKESAISVVVETAKDALAKLVELSESGLSEVAAKDLSGAIIGPACPAS